MRARWLALLCAAGLGVPSVGRATEVAVCFTPAETCVDRILSAIGAARREIRMEAYEFTSRPILAALVSAARRGVDVRIIVDLGAARRRSARAQDAVAAGLPVFVDEPPGIAHVKAIVIDGTLVIGGSYNYTRAAEKANVEDVTFITGAEIAGAFLRNWNTRLSASRPLTAAEELPARHRHRRRYGD